ncbi:MAG: hypothetical protein ACJA01_000313 [Saprospiraceae bacterium]|jgi:hypothetical protein
MNSTLNFRRIIYLLRNEIWIKWRMYLGLFIISCLLSGLVYVAPSHDISQLSTSSPSSFSNSIQTTITANGSVITSYNGYYISDLKYHLLWFPQLLFGLGIVFTSLTFWEYRMGNTRSFHLGVPATLFEKYFAKIFLTTIAFPLFFLLYYHLYLNITDSLGPKFGIEYVDIGWFDPYFWKYIGYFIILQVFFLVGAITYTKYSLIKSLIALGGIYVLYNTLVGTISFIKSGEFAVPSLWNAITANTFLDAGIGQVSLWIVGLTLIILLFATVYYKLQELEA